MTKDDMIRAFLTALDKKWAMESERKRSNAISPLMVDTLKALGEEVGYTVEAIEGLPSAAEIG